VTWAASASAGRACAPRSRVDVQESINLAIFRRFEEARIDFAYPSRTLYVQAVGGGVVREPGLTGDRP